MTAPTTSEGTFTTSDGFRLYTKSWLPTPSGTPPTAHIIFVHGFSDHINAYYDLFPTLSASSYNIAIYGYDQRGWGRSVHHPSDRGLTGPTSLVLRDLHEFCLHVTSTLPAVQVPALVTASVPLFLMAHSMGGGEALLYLLADQSSHSGLEFVAKRPRFDGLLLESPLIQLAFTPNPLIVFVGRMASKLFPRTQMKQALSAESMSRSEKVRREWVEDPLCHDMGTLEGLSGMLDRTSELTRISGGQKVDGYSDRLPQGCAFWVGHGDADMVNSWDASRGVVENVGVVDVEGVEGKVFRSYEGAYHKLHAEPEGVGEEFVRDVGEWILRRVKEKGSRDGDVRPKL